MARKDLLRGCDITHAQYEEVEFLATQWLFRHNVHELNFTSEETYDVRRELMDALEESFPLFDQDTRDRGVPRAWRERAIKSFITLVWHEFTQHPKLSDPDSPRKHRRMDDYRENSEKPRRAKGPQPAQFCLLAYCKLVFESQGPGGYSLSLPLRSIVEDDADVLDDNWNLNTAYVLHVILLCVRFNTDSGTAVYPLTS